MSYETMMNFYQSVYHLVKHANMDLSSVENMMPWEREVYFAIFLKELKDQNEARKNG
mgnify:FL=1